MKFLNIFQILFFTAFLLSATETRATVIEFNSNGTQTVHKAVDYLSKQRHNKFHSRIHIKDPKEYHPIIEKVSKKYAVSPDLIKAVINVESAFRADAVSPKGAQGLMQLMPATAKRFNVRDAFNPEQNIFGGTRYLKFLLKRYKGDLDLTLAAYNAGEGAVDKYKGIPPYNETLNYVRKVKASLAEIRKL